VWWPHPGPLPHGEWGKTKKRNHVGLFVLTYRLFKPKKKENNPLPQQHCLQAHLIQGGQNHQSLLNI
ncbi:hypothetical protein ACVGW7_01000, partial [Enterobacter intestinihominis]